MPNISEQLVSVEYIDNNRIQVIRVNDMTRQGVDAYVDVIQTEILDNEGATLLSVHDYSQVGAVISPYFLGRVKEFSSNTMRDDLNGRVAVVTAMDVFRLMFNPIVKMFSRRSNTLDIKFFKTANEAISWVSEYEAT